MFLDECKDIIYRCIKCGACTQSWRTGKPICPAGERFGFEAYYLMGRVEVVRGLLNNILSTKNSEKLLNVIYSCTDCRACVEQCYPLSGLDFHKCVLDAKRELVEEGVIGDKVASFLENVYEIGNPYGIDRQSKIEFLKDIGLPEYSGQEYLYYVDGVEGYDQVGRGMVKAFATLLRKLNISVGTLYDGVECSGNEVWSMGDIGLFEYLAEENIKKFKELNVKKIVVTSPHAYNAFKNLYPEHGYDMGEVKILHYTQFLLKLINNGKVDFVRELDYTVTYHDPCYLGRYNGIYDIPREIIKNIPGIKLKEMKRNREGSFCCGGGGGNFYTDYLGGGEYDPSVLRVKEAYELGVDTIIVACPICKIMLSSGVVSANLEGKIVVKDIAELILEAI